MINFSTIDHNVLLRNVNQLQIWSYIFGYQVELNTKYCNPLRLDKNPKCTLDYLGNNIVLKDWSVREYHNINIIEATKRKFGISYIDALNKILELNVYGNSYKHKAPEYIKDRSKNFKFKLEAHTVPFRQKDKDFWSYRGVSSQQLKEDNIKAVDMYRCNSRKYPCELFYFYSKLAYLDRFNSGNMKIILPDTEIRFITNSNEEDLGGIWTYDNPQLIISKSYKDYRQLKNLGYNTIYTMNEGCIPKSLIEICTKFKDVVIFFDNDLPGLTASAKLKTYIPNSRTVSIPLDYGCKDPDELKIMYQDIKLIINNIIT